MLNINKRKQAEVTVYQRFIYQNVKKTYLTKLLVNALKA